MVYKDFFALRYVKLKSKAKSKHLQSVSTCLKQILQELKEGTIFRKMQPLRCFQMVQATTATIYMKKRPPKIFFASSNMLKKSRGKNNIYIRIIELHEIYNFIVFYIFVYSHINVKINNQNYVQIYIK